MSLSMNKSEHGMLPKVDAATISLLTRLAAKFPDACKIR